LSKRWVGAFFAGFRSRAGLVVENLVLRQQLAVLRRRTPRPRLRPNDHAFWVPLSRVWSRWADSLAIVRPATVLSWHRRGFARFWARKSRRVGRSPLSPELVELIERIAGANPLWSRRRIAYEPAKLGYEVSKDSVAKYMPSPRGDRGAPPSQTSGRVWDRGAEAGAHRCAHRSFAGTHGRVPGVDPGRRCA
jgi:hypothetical protein